MSTLAVDNLTDTQGSALLGRRNVIINGNFGINQRGVSGTVSLSAGAYGHDRWKAGASGCTYTFATSENITTITITAGSLIQVVEGLNLVSGTHVLSWTGTAQGKIGAGSYDDSGVTGTVTGGSNLNIEFGTGTVSKVQLEVGTVATPFEHRSYGEELALCQRYYQSHSTPNNYGRTNTSNDNYRSWSFLLPVAMRATPTGSSSGGNASVTWNGMSTTFVWGEQNVGDSTSDKYFTAMTASAEL